MDVGATFCRTSRPDCEPCPARQWCRYAAAVPGEALDTPAVTAPAGRPPPVARERAAPFSSTSRWLRGRILDRLREAEGADWHELAVPIGDHDSVAVTRALELLAAEGLVERHPGSTLRARLPLG